MERKLDDAIRAVVDQAIASGEILQVTQEAKRLASTFGSVGLEKSDIAELLLKAGISARIALEWGDRRE